MSSSRRKTVTGFKPDAFIHQLTELPDEVDELPEIRRRNDRIRTEGTRNPVAATRLI